MKVKILKNIITGKVQSWSSGGVDVSSKNCEVIEKEFVGEDEKKLNSGNGYRIDDNLNVVEIINQAEIDKKQLKAKFQSGNFTNEDIKKMAEILL